VVIRRGEIWWAELPEPRGSEPGYRRPVLIVQADEFTASRIQTVLAIVVTSNLGLAEAPGNVLLPKRHTKLPKDSVANVSQFYTLNKSFLRSRVASVGPSFMQRVEEGLRLILVLQ
jgi:mRNA interferase MazF